MLLERKLEAVYKFKPHVKAGDKKVAAMAILGLIITKQMVECMEIDYILCCLYKVNSE